MEEEVNERIFLNGAPVVGFGGANTPWTTNPALPGRILGGAIGAVSGAALGALVGKGVGALVGAAAAGFGGWIIGGTVGENAPTPAKPWHRLQPAEQVKAGQQIAIALASPDGTPLTPDQLSQINSAIALIPNYNVTKVAALYPPGTPPPSDWPSDDNLGPGAFRVLITALVDQPPGKSVWQSSSVATVEAWAR